MKFVILTFMAGLLGFMAYIFFRGECAGGVIVSDLAACRGASFDAATCNAALAAGHRKAYREQAPFQTQEACLRDHPRCAPHEAVASGFVPVPRGICIARTGSGSFDGTPVYERIGARIAN
jgi:uncharacterized protein YgiB involved in biofilm formation